ncbi:hypothetical protein PLICRDRAFT_40003 [Plicaturopsis crispa FD-325 SS-3]|nr:hypothetical protein PLICRDRAFT_40003 [Plicaturopsis crispa FD-325 SS-3]
MSLESKVEVVSFTAQDKDDPRNWRHSRKIGIVLQLCSMSFCSVFGSSSYAPGEDQIKSVYGVNADLASVGLTVYLLGLGFGPMICPMSEMYGRKMAYSISWPLMIIFIAPSAFVPNFAVILVFRFLSGVCAACPINNGAGVCSDMLNNTPSVLSKGPIFGSLIGFFVAAHSEGSALWVLRVHFFFALALLPCAIFLPETHGPTILAHRAQQLRAHGHTNAFASHELRQITKRDLIHSHVIRPGAMLLTEPIAQGAAIWIGISYGIVYFFFEVFPVVFIQQHGIPFQLCGLTFMGIPLGMGILCAFIDPLLKMSKKLPLPGVERKNPPIEEQEARLKLTLLGCIIMPVSLFWFAWTSGSETHWIWPVLAGVPFGFSNLLIFWSFNAYTTATYMVYASSALGCNTFARSLLASFLPVVSHKILSSVGSKWGVTIFAMFSFVLVPIPLIFIRFGSTLRLRSHYATEARTIVMNLKRPISQEMSELDTKAEQKHPLQLDEESALDGRKASDNLFDGTRGEPLRSASPRRGSVEPRRHSLMLQPETASLDRITKG